MRSDPSCPAGISDDSTLFYTKQLKAKWRWDFEIRRARPENGPSEFLGCAAGSSVPGDPNVFGGPCCRRMGSGWQCLARRSRCQLPAIIRKHSCLSNVLLRRGFTSNAPGPAMQLTVGEKTRGKSREVQWSKIEAWVQSAGKPNEQAMKGGYGNSCGCARWTLGVGAF